MSGDTPTSDGLSLRELPPGADDWDLAFPVLQQLRGHLDRVTFERVHQAGAAQGLRFTAAFDGDGRCLGVAGWRVMDTTSVVRKLYVDDLVVDSRVRSSGIGSHLLRHVAGRGHAAGCTVLELDSGHQRPGAHRFYLREGMADVSRHFALRLDTSGSDNA